MNSIHASLPEEYHRLKSIDAILDRAEKENDVVRVMNEAAQSGFLPLLEAGIKRGYSLNPQSSKGPLYFALSAKKLTIADYMKENGASVHHKYQERSLLSHAAEKGHCYVVKQLLDRDAVVNGFHSYSPLHWATKNKNRDVVNLLLYRKANPNLAGSKSRWSPKVVPLAIALENRDYETILSLLRAGADPRGKRCYVPPDSGVHIKNVIKEYKNKK